MRHSQCLGAGKTCDQDRAGPVPPEPAAWEGVGPRHRAVSWRHPDVTAVVAARAAPRAVASPQRCRPERVALCQQLTEASPPPLPDRLGWARRTGEDPEAQSAEARADGCPQSCAVPGWPAVANLLPWGTGRAWLREPAFSFARGLPPRQFGWTAQCPRCCRGDRGRGLGVLRGPSGREEAPRSPLGRAALCRTGPGA